ncbi:MAG: 2-hydroxyacid dehydrogenase [Verrucomicrobia bacterium]|nr:2-hydroxyacid dehydrogenase [Verrucomicrobiota bacterium]
MQALVFSSRDYFQKALTTARSGHDLRFLETRLESATAPLAAGYPAVVVFVNDRVDRDTLQILVRGKTRLVATLSTGTNHIDVPAAREYGITVASVPSYSPHAVSEFTLGLILSLARHIPRACQRVRDNNFELEGLEGFELKEKTIGVVGTGAIGEQVVRNLGGFGCRILAHDPAPNPSLTALARYASQDEILRESDILTFHVPLLPTTRHWVNESSLTRMKRGVILVNTSRGAIFDTRAVISGLKSGQIGGLAIDVYEEEAGLFFTDHSSDILKDDVFARLLTFPNVLVTGHQAFLTDHALRKIAETTLQSLTEFESKGTCTHCINT